MMKKLDNSKATSREDFPTWLSQEGCEDLCIPMHDIVNTMLLTGNFPNFWKRAQITPLPKVTKPKQLKDFRPISLLFHLGKLCEQVLVDKLRNSIQKVILPDQYAYRPHLGTTDALLQLLDDITLSLEDLENKFVQIGCLDFSKAFDRLQPNIVLDKMRKHGINTRLLSIIADFLSNRKQCVRLNGNFSNYLDVAVGAPQGTKLGPLLWLFYVNDLKCNGFNVVKYADDTTFYKAFSDRHSSVAPAISHTQSWAEANHMILNADKTVIMNVSFNYKTVFDENVVLSDDTQLKPSDNLKFLGITVDERLSFSKHVDNLISSCNSRLYLLRQLKVIGMNSEGLKQFYVANIRSILSYASPAWFCMLSQTDKDRLERIQRSATRTIFPNNEYQDRLSLLHLPTLCDFIFSLGERHFSRIVNDPDHPLFSRLIFNTGRISSRNNTIFRPAVCRTQKRAKSFFPLYMSCANKK